MDCQDLEQWCEQAAAQIKQRAEQARVC
ncbi:hypothetical protein [Polaromonas sp.]